MKATKMKLIEAIRRPMASICVKMNAAAAKAMAIDAV
jgi:hypothetical protein